MVAGPRENLEAGKSSLMHRGIHSIRVNFWHQRRPSVSFHKPTVTQISLSDAQSSNNISSEVPG